jgi:hypothetical protein
MPAVGQASLFKFARSAHPKGAPNSSGRSALIIQCAAGHEINRLHRHQDNNHVCDESCWYLDDAAKMKDSDQEKREKHWE